MAKKGPNNNSSIQASTTGPPPQFMNAYENVVNRAQNVAGTPYQPYTGQLVAPLSQPQQQAIGEIGGLQGAANPDLLAAQGMFGTATQPLWPGVQQFSPGTISQYMSPYTQAVTQATQAQFQNLNAMQANNLTGSAIQQRAFGGDRAAVAQGILGGQEAAQEAPVLAQIQQQGYNTALGTFQQQQQAQLGANEANAWLASQAGFGEANLGAETQNLGLQGASALLGAGGLEQQVAQEQLNVPYQQFEAQQAFPFQEAGWLANQVEGAGSLAGGTTTGNYYGPNNSGGGAGTGIGTLVGAGIGTVIAPGVGTVVGGMLGGAVGGMFRRGGRVYYVRRGPGGMVPYAANGRGFDYVPAPSAGMMGRGPPQAVIAAPPQQKQQGGDSSMLPWMAEMMATRGGGSNLGGYMGSGISDAGMGALNDEALANVATGAAGLRRGGMIPLRRDSGGWLPSTSFWTGTPPGYPDRSGDPWPDANDPSIHLPPQSAHGVRVGTARPMAGPGDASPFAAYLAQVAGGLNSSSQPVRRAGGGMMRAYDDGGAVDDMDDEAGQMPGDPSYGTMASDAYAAPSQGMVPETKDPYAAAADYQGYTAPAHSSRISPEWMGVLGAAAAAFRSPGRSRTEAMGNALQGGLNAYGQATAAQDKESEREAEMADQSAYKKANLTMEARRFSDAADATRKRLKNQDEQVDIQRQRAQQTGAHETAMEGIEQQRADTAAAEARANAAYRSTMASRGYWEPSAPVLGDDGKPKVDPATGAPLYNWMDRYTGKTMTAPYDQQSGLGGRGGQNVSQWKYNAWLQAHPGDERGALDFVGGHKQMSAGDTFKAAHSMAAADYKTLFGSGDRPPPADPDAWLRARAQQYSTQLGAGGGTGATDPAGIR